MGAARGEEGGENYCGGPEAEPRVSANPGPPRIPLQRLQDRPRRRQPGHPAEQGTPFPVHPFVLQMETVLVLMLQHAAKF